MNRYLRTSAQYFQAHIFNTVYNNTFDVIPALTQVDRERVFRLRYQIFAVEEQFEPENPSQIERDAYDEHSLHSLLIHKESNKAVGTIRTIFPREGHIDRSFPMQSVVKAPWLLKDRHAMRNYCEISRLCISRSFRKQMRESGQYLSSSLQGQVEKNLMSSVKHTLNKFFVPYAPLGLLRSAIEHALDKGVTDCLFIVEPRLLKSLSLIGIEKVNKLGEPIEFHGIRQPISLNMYDNFENGRKKFPVAWYIVSDKGRLYEMAKDAYINQKYDERSRDILASYA